MQGSFKTTLHKVFKCTFLLKKAKKFQGKHKQFTQCIFKTVSSKNYLIPQMQKARKY